MMSKITGAVKGRKLLVAVTTTILLGGCYQGAPDSVTSNQKNHSTPSESASVIPAPATEAASATPAENWVYTTDSDEMRGKTSYFATNVSENMVDFDVPYGLQPLKLTLRKSATYGDNIMLSVPKGLLSCRSGGCTVPIKFDNGQILNYRFNSADGAIFTTIFLNGSPSKFTQKLKHAKSMYVEVTPFQQGPVQYKFDVTGLKWAHF